MDAPRAIFDANLYLNLLLSPDPDRALVEHLLKAAAREEFALLLPVDVTREIGDAVARRPYLAARVDQETLDALFARQLKFATSLPILQQEAPRIARDRNDDYLIALAVLNDADFIVTRDRDLLDLREVAAVRIVDPVTFLEVLRSKTE